MTPPPVYAPRALRHLPMWRIGPIRVKPCHIGPAPMDEPCLAGARAAAGRMAAEAEGEGGSHDLGFAVVHDGEAGTWLLMDWWAHGDILCQRLSHDAGAGFVPVDHRPLTACVWELAVLAHERDAWVRHMMRGKPSAEGYLADRLDARTV